ncbi:peptidoglycan DD-metalloendopeptidase family protein [Streptomyces sp. URMC 123]|uniref:murein hydrolase activator EnvC family protein n=1 Tax=Streptomyces sp. URMC 123 TaxID=3423403 RepID=UPI003F195943
MKRAAIRQGPGRRGPVTRATGERARARRTTGPGALCAGLLGALLVALPPTAASASAAPPPPPPGADGGAAPVTGEPLPPATEPGGEPATEPDVEPGTEAGTEPGTEPGPDEALTPPAPEPLGRPAPGGWSKPVKHYGVTVAYGVPGDWQAGRHTGVDFAVPVGTAVYAVGPGKVTRAGWGGDYGQMVMVRMDDGHYVVFAHLSEISVRVGQRVRGGVRVGSSGSTGKSSGPHLHFEVRRTQEYGSDVDPLAYLASKGIRV